MAGRLPGSHSSTPTGDVNFNGGLNSAGGNLSLQDNESSDLLNVDFNFLGSVLKRNGYTAINTTSIGGAGGIDANTILMLHLNNNVTDSELTPKTVTNNNVTFSSSVYKFGGYSGVFNGTNANLTVPDSADWNLGNAWTIDTWINIPSGGGGYIVSQTDNSIKQWAVYCDETSQSFFYYNNGLGGYQLIFTAAAPISINTWHHIAFQRIDSGNSASSWRIYIDGVSQTLTKSFGNWNITFPDVNDVLNIGDFNDSGSHHYFNGDIDELRISNIARYTGDFIPPISQYTVTIPSMISDGLWWYESNQSGTLTYYLICVTGGKIFYMSGFNGIWNDITGTVTITSGNICSFKNFFNVLYVTNGVDAPFQWTGTGNATTIPALLANSYTFTVSGITTNPAVGDTYTNNTVTFTVSSVNTSGTAGSIAGTIIATGASVPTALGNLTRTSGSGDATIAFTLFGVDVNITKAKYVEAYNNYIFLANVSVGTTTYPTRIYWSNLQDPTTWLTTSFIEVAINDGQQITGMKVLGDNLIIFKTRSIYAISFTGDPDIPFILQSGGKTNSDVGCVAPFSIQEVTNGLMFLSFDGLYYFDGSNSTKTSDRINPTILDLNTTRLSQARSMVQHNKHRYIISVPSASSNTNDTVITWDWYLNAFSVYGGVNAASMCTTFTSGYQEKICFGDYFGFYYQMDNGVDDYPMNVQTAINSYYYTNWKPYDDIIDEKVVLHVTLYYQTNNAVLTFSYSYDFNTSDTYTQTLSTGGSTDVYGTGRYGTATYAGTGGAQKRLDLNGRGRVIRYKFANANMSETFRIDGLGQYPNVETEQ